MDIDKTIDEIKEKVDDVIDDDIIEDKADDDIDDENDDKLVNLDANLPHCTGCGEKHNSGYQRCKSCFEKREKKCAGRCGKVYFANDPDWKGKDKCEDCYIESKRMVSMFKNDQELYSTIATRLKRELATDENLYNAIATRLKRELETDQEDQPNVKRQRSK